MAPVLKTGVPERVSGVRIPPLPPFRLSNLTVAIFYRRKWRNPAQIEVFFRRSQSPETLEIESLACASEYLRISRAGENSKNRLNPLHSGCLRRGLRAVT